MPWQPGQSGNPGGRPKEKPFRDALRMEALALARGEKADHPAGSLRANAQALLLKGDVAAIREIADRLDGRVPQAIVGDDEFDPIRYGITDKPMSPDKWAATHVVPD
jgi:hypothetical protein